MIETLGNIFNDFNFDEFQIPLSEKFAEIIKAVRSNNKNEKLKSYQTKIHQLVLPSFLCNANKAELNEIAKQVQHHASVPGIYKTLRSCKTQLRTIQIIPTEIFIHSQPMERKQKFFLTQKVMIQMQKHHKVISSIYGSGKVEKLIERLGNAKSEYKLLLYSIEEKALQFHQDKYHSEIEQRIFLI